MDGVEPCVAAYKLFHEINDIVGIKTTHKENVEALRDFVSYPVNREMISHLASKASDVLPVGANDPASIPDPSIPMLEYFIASVVERSHCQVPTLMTSLVYLGRLKERLPHIAQGLPCTRHRLFLASLILAAKYVNDSSPKNKHWALYSIVKDYPEFGFSLTEVNLMEKQLLYLLDWDLSITESDLLNHFEPFLAQVRWDRAAIRLEEELIRRQVYIDPKTKLPAPVCSRAAVPGTKAPTLRDRERAHASGLVYPDEELHKFLLGKCKLEKPEVFKVPALPPKKVVANSPIPTIEQEDSYSIEEYNEKVSYNKNGKPVHQAKENNGMFSLPEQDISLEDSPFNEYMAFENTKAHGNFPGAMSRSSTQDSYLSNNSSRFNSVSRDVTPASSMTSLSGDDLDYDCHDDEDQVDVFLNELNSANCSANQSPDFHYQQYQVPSKTQMPSYIPVPVSRAIRGRGQNYKSLSPQVRAYEKQAGNGTPQRVSPTQGHNGIGKKAKIGGESKSMARIRQTLQVYDAEAEAGDNSRATKRSRFLPRFLGGSTA